MKEETGMGRIYKRDIERLKKLAEERDTTVARIIYEALKLYESKRKQS